MNMDKGMFLAGAILGGVLAVVPLFYFFYRTEEEITANKPTKWNETTDTPGCTWLLVLAALGMIAIAIAKM